MTSSRSKWVKVRGQECIWRRRTSAGLVRYQVRVRYAAGQPPYRATFDTLDEAKVARNKARDDARAGRAIIDARTSKVTVGQVAEQYLAGKALAWSVSSRRVYASTWAALADTFADVPVYALQVSDVADWWHAEQSAANTRRQRLALLRSVLDRSSADLTLPNVARLFQPPRSRVAAKVRQVRSLDLAEVRAVLGAVRPEYRIVALLCLSLGLRSGEARGLTWDRVNFQTGEVTIDRQLVRLSHSDAWEEVDRLAPGLGFGRPKTDQSDGVVSAGPDLLDAIRAHVAERGLGPAGLIAHRDNGRPVSASAWQEEVRRVAEVTGVAWTGHALRHTRAMMAIDGGDKPSKVAADLRHSMQTLVRTYMHPKATVDGSRGDSILSAATDDAASLLPDVEAPAARTLRAPEEEAPQ